MRKILCLAIAFCIASGFTRPFAQEPTIRIALETDHFVFGQTVWATYTVTNNTSAPVFLSIETPPNAPPSLLRWSALAYGPTGNPVPIHKDYARYVGEDNSRPKKLLGPGESVILKQPVPVTDVAMNELVPGQYKLLFSLSYSLANTAGLWEKEATATATCHIDALEGSDAAYVRALQEAIRTCQKSELLRSSRESPLRWVEILEPPVRGFQPRLLANFPTSIYAACIIYERMRGYGEGDQQMFLRSIELGSYLTNSYPSESGWTSLTGRNAAAWWAKWIGIILKNHPNIWFADELRLKRAVDQIALKNYQVAAADLDALAKDPKGPVQGKAQLAIDFMKQKGWIK